MLYGFIVEQKHLHLSMSGGTPSMPLHFSTSSQTPSGAPVSVLAQDGVAYMNPTLIKPPAVILKDSEGIHISKTYTLNDLRRAEYVVACEHILIRGGKPVAQYDVRNKLTTGLGILRDGRVVLIIDTCTLEVMRMQFEMLGAMDATVLSRNMTPYMKYEGGHVHMGSTVAPVTVFEASTFETIQSPIVVIDAGHGGKDPGACGNGLQEKDVTLYMARKVAEELREKYEGTFLLIRNSDATIDLNERPKASNAIKADFYFSLHTNAHKDVTAKGFESFVYTSPSEKSVKIQQLVHAEAMDYLKQYGIVDRGLKRQNLCVVRETDCPSMLVETLFITNAVEAKLLTKKDVLDAICSRYVKGIAKGMGLKPKATVSTPPIETAMYTVQVGAYASRELANGLAERLKKAGYEAYVKKT